MKPWSDEAAAWLRLSLVSGIGPLLGLANSPMLAEALEISGLPVQKGGRISLVSPLPALLQALKASRPDSTAPIVV